MCYLIGPHAKYRESERVVAVQPYANARGPEWRASPSATMTMINNYHGHFMSSISLTLSAGQKRQSRSSRRMHGVLMTNYDLSYYRFIGCAGNQRRRQALINHVVLHNSVATARVWPCQREQHTQKCAKPTLARDRDRGAGFGLRLCARRTTVSVSNWPIYNKGVRGCVCVLSIYDRYRQTHTHAALIAYQAPRKK